MTGTSANNAAPARGGFTLLEIIIALALVAILVAASVPYMLDAFSGAAGDRASEAIIEKVQETRREAMDQGEKKTLVLTSSGIQGSPLPEGWILEVKGLNDSKFHAPSKNQSWDFTKTGICEPLSLRLSSGERRIEISFDALTAQPLHDDQ